MKSVLKQGAVFVGLRLLVPLFTFFTIAVFGGCNNSHQTIFYFVGSEESDLLTLLDDEGYRWQRYSSIEGALDSMPQGGALCVLARDYPDSIYTISEHQLKRFEEKKLRVYVEYATIGQNVANDPLTPDLERVVVSDTSYFKGLPYLSLMTINASPFLDYPDVDQPLLVIAKVAGFDKADFGLANTDTKPLLFKLNENILVATAPLSRFAIGRFMPEKSWKVVWESILSDLTGKSISFKGWKSYVSPSYGLDDKLPSDARRMSVSKGIKWYFNGHFLVDQSWEKDWVHKYIGDGSMPVGPELPADVKDGDGTRGVLEGHCSFIYYNGKQKYRYWLRNDVQGESSMAFALAGTLLGNEQYRNIARNLSDFSFERFRQGSRNDPNSPSYGLLSWSATQPGTYYGDDNARSVLGTIVASAALKETKWNQKILEVILANFRTTGKFGFRGDKLQEEAIQENGWQYYWQRDLIYPHPHMEAWPLASYLWLYSKTGEKALFEKTKSAIRIIMDSYPNEWKWMNGIQQERARMILPLAWLVRIEPTDEHVGWLTTMADELLKNQVPSGGIIEELGDPSAGFYGKPNSNAEYGTTEAPLISNNGDPIVDMLYTTNFAFVGMNEAAKATGNPRYVESVHRMSDFLTRIQVRSDRFKNLDGAWYRAFNFHNWDYWAANADAGWGAWSTLTGWTQSWIVGTQALIELDSSIWEITENISFDREWKQVKETMFPDGFDKLP